MRKKKQNRDEDFDYVVTDENLGWSLPDVDAEEGDDEDLSNHSLTEENSEDAYSYDDYGDNDEYADEEDNSSSVDLSGLDDDDEPEYEEKPKKKKKGLFGGLFGRKKKKQEEDDFDESEDTYYGIQVKPIDELKVDYDPSSHNPMDDTFTKLFDDSVTSLDDEIEENFNKIQRERRRRVAEAVENAGVNMDEVADEFGIIAPPPVTSYTGEIDLGDTSGSEDDFTKAMNDSAKSRTMEIKLNVLNDTIELQKVLNVPTVDSDSANEIAEQAKIYNTTEINIPESLSEDESSDDYEDVPEENYEETETQDDNYDTDVADDTDIETIETDENTPDYYQEFPTIEDQTRYRDATLPVHNIDLDVVQSAILTESEDYDEETGEYRGRKANVKKSKFKLFEGKEETPDESGESIDDYTSPEDAPSIKSELKDTISKLGMRTFVTGISTVVVFFLGLVLEGRGNNVASAVYAVISLILVCVAAGFCWRNILEGIQSLIRFEPTSDSAAAVAVVAVVIQHLGEFVSIDNLSTGNHHLYGALAIGIIFLNSVGKLSMVRRIYTNFRFLTAREEKYSVRVYEDYNTALKLAGDSTSGAPKIAYQRKAGFLKRFLELSYDSDPSEEASKNIAPYGLVLSLILCIITILTTSSINAGLSALAASAVATCIATNMVGLNIPFSKFTKKVKRAGAMVSCYQGVEEFADVTSVMLSDTDLFPKGTVTIGGIKAFDNDNLEEAVVAATAMINQVGGTLADVFGQVITDSGVELPKIENLSLEDNNGVSAMVNDQHILVGNRDILITHNITPPEREDIMKYLEGGKKPLFIAVDGKLKAMIVVQYKADKRRKVELNKLKDNEVGLIVYSMDPNLTNGFVSKLFGIGESRVNVVHGQLASDCIKDEDKEITRADALVATKGRPESLLSVVNNCIKQKKLTKVIVMTQLLGALLGFLIVVLVTLGSAGAGISAVSLLFFEILWTVIVLIIPKVMEK